jgi:hypothetical protein
MAYYAFLPTSDAKTTFTVTSFASAQVVLRYRGFWAIVGITLGHFVLCVLALIEFALFTKSSLLKNAWEVIADVSEKEQTRPLLEHVHETGTSEGEVGKWVKQNDKIEEKTDFFEISSEAVAEVASDHKT